MVEGVAATPYHIAAKAAMGVFEEAGSPMLARGHGQLQTADRLGLPPLQDDYPGKTKILDQVFDSPGDDSDGRPARHIVVVSDNAAQRGPVEMIHMRVGEQHHVNGRQVLDLYTRPAQAAQGDKPFGEDGVDEHLAAANLYEKRGVANERNPQLSG